MSARRPRRRSVFCEPLEPRLVLATTPVVIDLLAVYTPAAATQVGGDAHMLSLIQTSVDSMNQALINSNVSATIRLVHTEPIAYANSGDVYTDRIRLETSGDGYMDGIFTLRNQYGADLVTLISDGIGGGNADLMTDTSDPNNPNLAFSAVFASGIGPGYLTIAHELGHNLGAGHERNNPTQPAVGPFPYSYGYRFPVNDPGVLTASFNDIMSYAYGNDIPLFQYSNPNVLLDGTPTGLPPSDPNSADLYDTFLQTAPIVAAYRSTAVADNSAPTARLFEINRSGSSLTFTVRYTDDSGIDLSTIGAGDFTVSGPGGFVLPATFVSMDRPSFAGAYKFATYHVTLPATNPSTDSLSFNLLPGAVTDIHAHPAAPGAISQHTAYYAGSPFEASGTYASYAWAQPLSTNLSPGSSFTEYGSLGPDDRAHYYSFTLTQPATVKISLSGFSADCNMYITTDANHNDLDDDATLTPDNGYNSGTGPEDLGLTLAAGTYYIHVDQPVASQTPYTLTVRANSAGVDITPPTAVADTKDLTTSGAPYIDFAVTYSDDFDFNGVSARFDAAVDIHSNTYGYTFYYYPDFTLNPYYYADASSITIYYRIYAFDSNTGWTAADNDTFTLSVHDPGPGNSAPRDAAGNHLPLIPLGSFKIDIGNPDITRPTATLSASPPVPGQSLWTFNVLYKDSGALNTSSLGNSNLRVTGPGGYDQPATFVSAIPTTNVAGSYLATYTAHAPGGFWDGTDDGAYTVSLQSNQVRDAAGNYALATSFPAVVASSPYLVAVPSPAAVSFVGTANPDTMRVDADANFVYFTLNDSLLYFLPKTSVPRFNVSSLGGDDAIYFQSGTLTGTISPGTGSNTLAVTGGSLTLDADVGAAAPLAVTVSSAAALTLTTTQHFTSLSLSDSAHATLAPGGTKVLVVRSLTTSGSASLDLTDNAAIIDFSGTSPVSTVRAMLATGYASGAWTGPGIVSSTAASTPHRGIAYAETSVFGTQPFAGQSVDATAVLLKYSYLGDANLNGTIDRDDYALADRGRAKGLDTWVFGDFDYSASVTAADYVLLDRSFAALNPPAPATPVVSDDDTTPDETLESASVPPPTPVPATASTPAPAKPAAAPKQKAAAHPKAKVAAKPKAKKRHTPPPPKKSPAPKRKISRTGASSSHTRKSGQPKAAAPNNIPHRSPDTTRPNC